MIRRVLGTTWGWFAVWAVALYLVLLALVWEGQGQALLAFLVAVAVLGLMTSLIAAAIHQRG
jgi:hypothetical protein